MFPVHTLDTAPPASRRLMEATVRHQGRLPAPVARLAESPELLGTFLRASSTFETTTLAPVEREVVIMTVAVRNGCHVCVAMHSARLDALGAEPALIPALRAARPLADERLEAVRRFTLAVLDSAGEVGTDELDAFRAAGYTARNALEVVLGIGTYTMSTLANRLVRAPLDEELRAYA